MTHSARSTAFASLPLSLLLLSACPINPDAIDDVGQTNCAESFKAFDPAGASVPTLPLTRLPVGVYRLVSTEVYLGEQRRNADGTDSSAAIHYRGTAIANTSPVGIAGELRCRESSGRFTAFSEQPLILSDVVRYDASRFDVATRPIAVSFQTADASTATFGFPYETRSTNPGWIADLLSRNWNGGYHFAHREGETYEFYGSAILPGSGRSIRGKSVFIRSNLP